jgi:enterochelin esterase-like enzyme
LPQSGVPAGTVSDFSLEKSGTYPGYSHRWWLYVPAGYDGKTPLALMVFQDGRDFVARDGTWRVPVALDNLIFRNELPLMVALFIDPGHAIRPTELASEQRSYEYDTLSDQYARFVITEMLPEIKKHVRVTDNPNGRGIAGFSSGGTCAFTVAWRRSDQFRKIFSANGSFVNIRGAGAYPDIVRQSPRKRLRVFLQDGVNDEPGGRFRGLNWPEGNRAMAAALASKGYDYQLEMGEGMHTGRHGAAIFPDAMRWLWRDYRAQ